MLCRPACNTYNSCIIGKLRLDHFHLIDRHDVNPFTQLRFIPTGGVKLENAAEYLRMEKVHTIGGSWMAKPQMIADGKFEEITRMAKEASDIVKQVRRDHP